MSQIVIGEAGHKNVAIDLKTLLATRLLLTADSGGGKTWAMKRLIEQAFGHVGILVIDPEGEFAPMRQKLDFYLVGKGGDTPADPRSAGKVARALLSVRASAICDIYELKPAERHAFVKAFLEALIEAPKDLRRPYLVIVDEAHMFCPEKGKGESEAAESMRDLCTRGRKRLLCAIFATQRLAALSKDASGMLLNRLIGPTFEKINRVTAAEILSIPREKKERDAFLQEIQLLEPGNFYALGRAISRELVMVHVGPIETPHGDEARKYEIEPPPPTEKVRELLAKLGDLPKQAEEEARTEAELKKQIRGLKAELRARPVNETLTTVNKPVTDERAIARAVAAATKPYRELLAADGKVFRDISSKAQGLKIGNALVRDVPTVLDRVISLCDRQSAASVGPVEKVSGGEILRKDLSEKRTPAPAALAPAKTHPRPSTLHEDPGGDVRLKAGALKMLAILAQWHPQPRTRDQIGALAGFAPEGGTFGEYMRALSRAGYITENGQGVHITDEGLANAGDVPERPDTTEELVSMWKSKFKAGAGKMLQILVDEHPHPISEQDLGERSGFAPEGGTFGEYLRALRRSGLIEENDEGVKAAESLFP